MCVVSLAPYFTHLCLSWLVVEVHFEESRITVNESVGTVEVCLVKEGVTSRVITVTVVVQELLTDNSASGRHTVSMEGWFQQEVISVWPLGHMHNAIPSLCAQYDDVYIHTHMHTYLRTTVARIISSYSVYVCTVCNIQYVVHTYVHMYVCMYTSSYCAHREGTVCKYSASLCSCNCMETVCSCDILYCNSY